MRAFSGLSQARRRYHESIGLNQSNFPEGHVQVEYPRRAFRRTSKTRSVPPARSALSTQARPPTDPIENAGVVAEPKLPTHPLVDMKAADQKTSISRYVDGKGKPVQGYESHCSSSETQKQKLRPQDISTRKTWQKMWPTVIQHNPISTDQTIREGSARGNNAQQGDAQGEDIQEGKEDKDQGGHKS